MSAHYCCQHNQKWVYFIEKIEKINERVVHRCTLKQIFKKVTKLAQLVGCTLTNSCLFFLVTKQYKNLIINDNTNISFSKEFVSPALWSTIVRMILDELKQLST